MTFEVTSATYVEAVASAQIVDVALPFSYPLAVVSVSYLDAVVSYAQYLDAVVVMGHLVYAAEPEPTDTTAPTLAITAGAASIYQGATTSLTFAFSEDVGATFTQTDVVVTGGTLSSFTGSGANYSATFTATSVGTASISVASGAYADAAGNLGAAASRAVDVLEVYPFFSIGSTQPYSALSSLMSMGSDPVTMEYKTVPFTIRFGEN